MRIRIGVKMATESTETGQESVYTDNSHQVVADESRCLYCRSAMKPRKGKLFCNNKHRWLYHNVVQKNELKAFAEEINDLLEKHGLLRNRNGGSIHEQSTT
jgi:hypothetical protein